MIKYLVSKTIPWWIRENDNKPAKHIFEKWCNENLVTTDKKITITYDNYFYGTLHANFKEPIKYIEITNDEINYPLYYFIESIDKIGPQGTFSYRIKLDLYATHTLKYLELIKNKKLIFNRTHQYDPKCLELTDSFLDSIPKIYENFTFKRKYFLKQEDTWYGEAFAIKGNDLLNANKYYVFKDGVNGGYRFYPIVSKNLKTEFTYTQRKRGELIFQDSYWNGLWVYFGEHKEKVDIPDTVNEAVVNAYKNNDIVVFESQMMHYVYEFPAHTIILRGWKELENIPWKTLPIDVRVNTDEYNNAGAGLRALKYFVYANGIQTYFAETWNITSSKHWQVDDVANKARELRVSIYKNVPETKAVLIDNSLTSLEILRKNEKYINKFLGIFYLPHLLTFKNCSFNRLDNYNFLYIDIDPKGEHMDTYSIFEYNLSNIQDKLNNDTYTTPYLLKYMDVKYYGNRINVEFRVNNQQQVFIAGKILFTDSCNIIAKNTELLSLENSIIAFPYQLPIGVDQYEQYVKANRGVTDTGMAIARQQQELSFGKSVFGGVMNTAQNIVKAGMGGDMASAVFGTWNTAGSLGFDLVGQFQGLQQQQAKIQAQYQQVQMTTGNNIQFSNINHAALMEYYDSNKGEQFEGVAISEIDKSTLINLNNYITLNGYMNPQEDTLNNRINNNRKFNYVQINPELLINSLTNYDSLELTNDVFNLIISQLTNGIRIWNTDDLHIDEYNPNEEWPIPPRPEIPDYPMPDVPIPPKPIDEITITEIGITEKNKYFDNNGQLQDASGLMLLQYKLSEIPEHRPILVMQTDTLNIYDIINNGVENFTINWEVPWDDKYNNINFVVNRNISYQYKLDNLNIKVKDDRWLNLFNSKKDFRPDYSKGGWFNDELKNISVVNINVTKV